MRPRVDDAGMASVCFVTCLAWPDISASDQLAAEALERHGITVVGRPWNAPGAVFEGHDAVILRSSWDYHLTPDHYLAWLARCEGAGLNLWNPPALVRWNVSKRYLLDLEAKGVAIVPTVVTTADRVADVLEARGWPTAVVKPAIGASAHGTVVVERAAGARGEKSDREVIVQPFVEEIRNGEWSLIFIDGELAHAVLKRPAAGDFRVQAAYGGKAERATPPESVIAAGRRAVAALPVAPLYARIDGVETRDGFLVMEAEVNEPALFFPQGPESAGRFAAAIRARI